jgi:putative ABC transport system permease protein
MTGLTQDIRFAMRGFRRSPGFFAVAVAVLALGIGANTAIFSVVDAVVLRPLPYASPDQLVVVGLGGARGRPGRGTASWPTFRDWRAQSRALELVAYHGGAANLTGAGVPERLSLVASTANLFDLLGTPPVLGRGFAAGDDQPGRNRVVVLSDGLWRRRFGADPRVLGRVLTLDGAPYTVIGVAGPHFRFPPHRSANDIWVPVPQGDLDANQQVRRFSFLQLVGRMAPGMTLAGAQAELEAAQARVLAQHPEDRDAGGLLTANDLQAELVGTSVRQALFTLLAAVGVVLLIACANVANLLLARGSERARELAVRAALGAGRARMVRQVLTESALLGIAGGALGVGLALWALDALLALVPATMPRPSAIAIDGRVLAFSAAAALVTSVLFGLVPALSAARADVHGALKQAGRTGIPGRGRLGGALLVGEIALSFLLLVGAGLALRSFARVTAVDPGFDPRGLLTASVSLPDARYGDRARIGTLFDQLLARARALPGVEGAALAMPLAYTGDSIHLPFVVLPGAGAAPGPAGRQRGIPSRFVSPEYFRLMGISLVAGRLLDPTDERAGAPAVAVVSESLARDLFRGGPALGRRLDVTDGFPGVRTIVGVVSDARNRLEEPRTPQLYLPFNQPTGPIPLSARMLLVRTRGAAGPAAIVKPLQAELAALDAALPLGDVETMEQRLAGSLQQRRLSATLLALFAGLALVLAAAGIYGVTSYAVSQRTRELGVRMALGAQRARVLRMVLGQGLRVGLLGVGLGLGAALASTRLIASQLYGISPTDPPTFVALGGLLLLVTVAAALLPARRATQVDPMVALRAD